MLKDTEMPRDEQFFNVDLYHFGSRHSSYTQTGPDMDSSKRSNIDGLGTDAKTHG